jgi:hypothetical protein
MQPHSLGSRQPPSQLGAALLRSATSAPEAERKRASSLPGSAPARVAHTVQHAADTSTISSAGNTKDTVLQDGLQPAPVPPVSGGTATGLSAEAKQADADAAEVKKQWALARYVNVQPRASCRSQLQQDNNACVQDS